MVIGKQSSRHLFQQRETTDEQGRYISSIDNRIPSIVCHDQSIARCRHSEGQRRWILDCTVPGDAAITLTADDRVQQEEEIVAGQDLLVTAAVQYSNNDKKVLNIIHE